MTLAHALISTIVNPKKERKTQVKANKLIRKDTKEWQWKPTLFLGINMPELVLTSLSLLSPDSLSATSDLFNSDLAYHRAININQTKSNKTPPKPTSPNLITSTYTH